MLTGTISFELTVDRGLYNSSRTHQVVEEGRVLLPNLVLLVDDPLLHRLIEVPLGLLGHLQKDSTVHNIFYYQINNLFKVMFNA